MTDEETPKMSRKGYNLAVKDYFPTPQIFNTEETGDGKILKTQACYGGPGITVREVYALEILKGLLNSQACLVDTVENGEMVLVEKSVKIADNLIEYLANNEAMPEGPPLG